jgi:hypothetical protein
MSREKGEGSGVFGLAAGPAVPALDCDETIPAAITPKPAFKTSRRSNMSYRRKVGLEPIREAERATEPFAAGWRQPSIQES